MIKILGWLLGFLLYDHDLGIKAPKGAEVQADDLIPGRLRNYQRRITQAQILGDKCHGNEDINGLGF